MKKSDYEKIYIVIPVFNEENVISDVINSIQKQGFKNIIVVDDGSTDNTRQILKSYNIILLKHLINRGKGAATQTGMDMAKILEAEATVTIDGDGQHYADDIFRVASPIISRKFDISIGSRFISEDISSIPFSKILANRIANLMTLLFYGIYVSDSQSGFRAYSLDALKTINTTQDRYEFESEVLHQAENNHLKIKEVPIKVKYTEYSKNKYKSLKNFSGQGIYNGIRMVIKMIIRSIMT